MKGKVFTAQEVQSIIAGNKTMFRGVIKKPLTHFDDIKINQDGEVSAYNKSTGWHEELKNIKCPYQVGQKIFVKEVFCKSIFGKAIYKDEEKEIRGLGHKELSAKWKPAQQMKQEHSRLTLLIKEIRVERLADITLDDVIKEGTQIVNGWDSPDVIFDKFQEQWNATHKKPEEKFEANPFVWCVSFEVINN